MNIHVALWARSRFPHIKAHPSYLLPLSRGSVGKETPAMWYKEGSATYSRLDPRNRRRVRNHATRKKSFLNVCVSSRLTGPGLSPWRREWLRYENNISAPHCHGNSLLSLLGHINMAGCKIGQCAQLVSLWTLSSFSRLHLANGGSLGTND